MPTNVCANADVAGGILPTLPLYDYGADWQKLFRDFPKNNIPTLHPYFYMKFLSCIADIKWR